MITDLLVLIWVIFGVQIAWFGFDSEDVAITGRFANLGISYTAVSVGLLICWMAVLAIYSTRDARIVGTGVQEYRRIADGTFRLFGLIAILAYLLKFDLARGYVLIALPLGLVVLIFARWMWRQWLNVKRAQGEYSARVVLVGSVASVEHIARELRVNRDAGYLVVAKCTTGATAPDGTLSIPSLDDPVGVMNQVGADTLVITSADDLSPERVRAISWELQPGVQHLVVAPSLVDIGGPRIHTRPVSGLPLLHIETPRYEGGRRYMKRAFDIVVSASLLVLLSPMFAALAMAIRLSSAGPIFYRQERVGRGGEPFAMLKFRSMVVDADSKLEALLRKQGTEGVPLFKVENDPRVTPIGRIIRKHSLDEFPQLINVLRGDMSLVGPRPQRAAEVELYDYRARRRLIVQPGMTGLWQVSGRSSLSWEDAIRLDLYYVENWSLTADLVLLGRTIRAVIAPGKEAH